MDIRRIHGGKRISRAVVHNNIVYLAGILALQKRGGTVAEQTRDILGIIDQLLAEAGSPGAIAAFAALVGSRADDRLAGFHLKRLLNGATGTRIALG